MKIKSVKTYYRRRLPHLQPVGGTFFVTFRLYNSIPKSQLFKLKADFENRMEELKLCKAQEGWRKMLHKARSDLFLRYDNLLDQSTRGPHFLKKPVIAEIIKEQLHRFNGKLYQLLAYTVMSNHVHILIDTSLQLPEEYDPILWESFDFKPLDEIMRRIKGASARYANIQLEREGRFWQSESYDCLITSDKQLDNVIAYILSNPVKAGLVDNWEKYPYSYVIASADL